MCDIPLIGIKFGIDPITGKYRIKLKKRLDFSYQDYCSRYGEDNVLLIPCGHCSACVLARRKEWSLRCVAESLYHEKNCFVTLTYDDDHLAFNMSQCKSDVKKFIKSIRNSGFKVRYFACGERGERNRRIHSHIILFGFMPDDLSYCGCSDSGEAMFTSNFIDTLWNKGRCIVQFFGESVGSYVAGYTSKKLGERDSFQIQSSKPGIGFQFARDNISCILKYDQLFLPINGGAVIPRYFSKVIESYGFSFPLDILKDERLNKSLSNKYHEARIHGFSHLDQQIHYSKVFNDTKLSWKVRSL